MRSLCRSYEYGRVRSQRSLRGVLLSVCVAAALAVAFYLLVVSGALGGFAQWFGDIVAANWRNPQ
jgi:hypothetical protein